MPPMKFNGAAIASRIAWIGARIVLTSDSNLLMISFRMPSTSVSINMALLNHPKSNRLVMKLAIVSVMSAMLHPNDLKISSKIFLIV